MRRGKAVALGSLCGLVVVVWGVLLLDTTSKPLHAQSYAAKVFFGTMEPSRFALEMLAYFLPFIVLYALRLSAPWVLALGLGFYVLVVTVASSHGGVAPLALSLPILLEWAPFTWVTGAGWRTGLALSTATNLILFALCRSWF